MGARRRALARAESCAAAPLNPCSQDPDYGPLCARTPLSPQAMQLIGAASDASASHNCWAWKVGAAYRSSDDGEPGGTAVARRTWAQKHARLGLRGCPLLSRRAVL